MHKIVMHVHPHIYKVHTLALPPTVTYFSCGPDKTVKVF